LRGVLYRLDRSHDARRIAEELRREVNLPSKGAITILETAIPAAVVYREAATYRAPVHRFDRRRGARPSALNTLEALVAELFPHLKTSPTSSGE
jgi:chromosome partitioning related protein ParA